MSYLDHVEIILTDKNQEEHIHFIMDTDEYLKYEDEDIVTSKYDTVRDFYPDYKK